MSLLNLQKYENTNDNTVSQKELHNSNIVKFFVPLTKGFSFL